MRELGVQPQHLIGEPRRTDQELRRGGAPEAASHPAGSWWPGWLAAGGHWETPGFVYGVCPGLLAPGS